MEWRPPLAAACACTLDVAVPPVPPYTPWHLHLASPLARTGHRSQASRPLTRSSTASCTGHQHPQGLVRGFALWRCRPRRPNRTESRLQTWSRRWQTHTQHPRAAGRPPLLPSLGPRRWLLCGRCRRSGCGRWQRSRHSLSPPCSPRNCATSLMSVAIAKSSTTAANIHTCTRCPWQQQEAGPRCAPRECLHAQRHQLIAALRVVWRQPQTALAPHAAAASPWHCKRPGSPPWHPARWPWRRQGRQICNSDTCKHHNRQRSTTKASVLVNVNVAHAFSMAHDWYAAVLLNKLDHCPRAPWNDKVNHVIQLQQALHLTNASSSARQ